jgi:hypothetical protein
VSLLVAIDVEIIFEWPNSRVYQHPIEYRIIIKKHLRVFFGAEPHDALNVGKIISGPIEFHEFGCELAQHGYSRDHRGDRPQIVIGMMCTADGCPVVSLGLRCSTICLITTPSVPFRNPQRADPRLLQRSSPSRWGWSGDASGGETLRKGREQRPVL